MKGLDELFGDIMNGMKKFDDLNDDERMYNSLVFAINYLSRSILENAIGNDEALAEHVKYISFISKKTEKYKEVNA